MYTGPQYGLEDQATFKNAKTTFFFFLKLDGTCNVFQSGLEKFIRVAQRFAGLVQDDLKLLDDGGEIPKSLRKRFVV